MSGSRSISAGAIIGASEAAPSAGAAQGAVAGAGTLAAVQRRIALPALLLGLLCTGIGGKWLLVRSVATGVPYWDEWDGDGIRIIAPYEWHKLEWLRFFDLHNEHRPALTRTANFAIYLLNDRMWDTRVTVALNALLHVGLLVFFVASLRPIVRGRGLILVAAVAALATALPFAWENTLIGFQSAFYFMLATAVASLRLLAPCPRCGWTWWGGVAVALLGLFSIAGGFVVGPAIGAIAILRACALRRREPSFVPNLGAAILLIALGVLLTKSMPYHASQRAHSAWDFLRALGNLLAWPFPSGSGAWLWVHLPSAVFLAALVRRRTAPENREWFLAAVALWYLLQVFVLALVRSPGVNAAHAARYLDIHGLGITVSTACLVQILGRSGRGKKRMVAGAAWFASTVAALAVVSTGAWSREILPFRYELAAQEARVAAFVRSGDASLIREAPEKELPYPGNTDWLLHLLTIRELVRALPPSVRPALAIHPPPSSGFGSAGVPAGIGPSGHGLAWGSAGSAAPASWISASVESGYPILRIRTAAAEPRTASVSAEYADGTAWRPGPGAIGAGAWKTMNIPTHGKPVSLRISSPGGGDWIAFTDLVEVGALSWLVPKVLSQAGVILGVGIALLAAAALLPLARDEQA